MKQRELKRLFPTLMLLYVFSGCIVLKMPAQTFVHNYSKEYIYPEEPAVKQKLEEWQDLKFGILIHFGLYSYLGCNESWPICSDRHWRDTTMSYTAFKEHYWEAANFFRPMDFNPERWSEVSKKAGMKYVVFTTKHHDGFNMYDTKYSDYSITKYAFKNQKKNNITKEVFDAYRKDGFVIGAYYSKADWHSQDYWWDKYATPDRYHNYDSDRYPERWQRFKQFCYNQIEELMNGDYGKIDILWLDGGWVRPSSDEIIKARGAAYTGSEDIDMPGIASMARNYQPGLLVVDRTVSGKYENYRTPEQIIPEEQMDTPWETCLTLGKAWGYKPGDNQYYKSPSKEISILAEIVAKGGSYLLAVAPNGDGIFPAEAENILIRIGKWLDKNGEAIYGTRITKHYHDGNTWFVQSKDAGTLYAIYCPEENTSLPKTIVWEGNEPEGTMTLLQTNRQVKYSVQNGKVTVMLPSGLNNEPLAFRFKPKNK